VRKQRQPRRIHCMTTRILMTICKTFATVTSSSLTDISFGAFVLQRNERRLLSGSKPLLLGARAFDVLTVLLENAGQLVTKQRLFEQVWSGTVVEENNLQVHVSTLRRLLGADVIATVAGRGYRLTAAVNPATGADTSNPKPSSTSASMSDTAPASQGTAQVDVQKQLNHLSHRRTVAVLPFVNLDGDADQEYFSDGLAEDIITHLTHSPWLLVLSRNSSFTHRNSAQSSEQIGQALGARYLVLGSVRKAATQLRMTAELVDTHNSDTLWSDRYDRPLTDLFKLQATISAHVVSTIEPVYLRREERLSNQVFDKDMQHWDMLMRARWHFWLSTKNHIDQAQGFLQKAMALKPSDSPTLSLMAFTHLAQVWGSWAPDPRAAIAEATRLSLAAIRNDDRDAFAHFTLGAVLSCTGQIDWAIAELERALSLYPQFAAAAGELGRLLVFAGRTEEAAEYVLQAIDASPHDPHLSLWMRTRAIGCFIDGNHADALRYATSATAKRPDWFFNHFLLAACQAATGDLMAAKTSMANGLAHRSYTLQAFKFGHPFVHPHHAQAFSDALKLAGWNP
jgi:TolB-like protein/Tfp pilus assembly protein PilF